MRAAFLVWFAFISFVTAMCYDPEPVGYSRADVNALNQLVELSVKQKNPGASRRYIAELFGREDLR